MTTFILPADIDQLSVLRCWLDEVLQGVENAGNKMIGQIKLAVHEVCANIIEHGYAGNKGQILVVVSTPSEESTVVVELHDEAPNPFYPAENRITETLESTRGRGLLLIGGLMDEVIYVSDGVVWNWVEGCWLEMGRGGVRENAGNYWRLVKKVA